MTTKFLAVASDSEIDEDQKSQCSIFSLESPLFDSSRLEPCYWGKLPPENSIQQAIKNEDYLLAARIKREQMVQKDPARAMNCFVDEYLEKLKDLGQKEQQFKEDCKYHAITCKRALKCVEKLTNGEDYDQDPDVSFKYCDYLDEFDSNADALLSAMELCLHNFKEKLHESSNRVESLRVAANQHISRKNNIREKLLALCEMSDS